MRYILLLIMGLTVLFGGSHSRADDAADRRALVLRLNAVSQDLGTLSTQTKTAKGKQAGDAQPTYYKFSTGATALAEIELSGIAGKAKLMLYDQRGYVVTQQDRAGAASQKIDRGLYGGTYYLAVIANPGAVVDYSLTIKVGPLGEYGHHTLAFDMPAGLSTSVFAGRFPDQTETNYKWARFVLETAGELRIDLISFDKQAALDLVVYRDGKMLKELKTKDTIASFLQTVSPGEFYARISNGSSGDVQFRLDVRLMSKKGASSVRKSGTGNPKVAGRMGDPVVAGRIITQFGSWKVGVNDKRSIKHCFAYTIANAVTPVEWRKNRPILYFQVSAGGSALVHRLDLTKLYQPGRLVRAVVSVKGKATVIPAVKSSPKAPDWRTLERCGNDKQKWCVSNEGLRALTAGTSLTLAGTAADGRTTRIVYPITGYAEAVTRMTKECDAKTYWLVKK